MITPEPFTYSDFEVLNSELEVGWEGEVNRNSPDYVRWVQDSLNKILDLRLAVDGVMGPATRSAIRSFQQSSGLTADGIVGQQTEAALMRAGAPRPPGSGQVQGDTAVVITDVTAQVLDGLAAVPASRHSHHPQPWPPSAWHPPELADVYFAHTPPVAGRDIQFDIRSIRLSSEDLVVEVQGAAAPRLIAVSWPRAIARRSGAPPAPFLVYFHPTVGQNVGAGYYVGPGLGTYPYGWDYLYYGLWRYLNYISDPLIGDPYCKGFPYQIAASSKNMVLVLPLNRHPGELVEFLDAGSMERILNALNAFMYRRAGVAMAPPPGRVALGAFSSGNILVNQFLVKAANRGHPFYQNTLQELYMFDVPNETTSTWVTEALRWARSGTAAGKVIRTYTRSNHSALRSLLDVPLPLSTPFAIDSSDGLRTVTVLPDEAWRRATSARGAPRLVQSWQEPHQLISATMLTDAMRRSL
jgi:hypothetical protein